VKRDYVNELTDGARVDSPFALRSKETRSSRNGEPYLALELADRTGQIAAICFRPNQNAMSAPVGSVVAVRGVVASYRGTKRIRVEEIAPACSWEAGDIIASISRPHDELMSEFKELVSSVRDRELRSVLLAVFRDPAFLDRFARCPGSQSYHHAYLGGLLEHTVSVARLCRALAEQYDQVDRDLLVSAALLHDVGKCEELSFDTSIEFTDEGRLVGHVVLGMRLIGDAIARAHARVAPARLTLLQHAVLSHHGELEWGSPKRPSTLEALLLHHADNLDAKASGFSAILAGASRAGAPWTDASNLFRRPLWAPRPAEDDRPQRPVEDVSFAQRTA
jgi:3'-5' exoribonuclease